MASSKSFASAGSIVKVSTFLKSFLSFQIRRRNGFRQSFRILPVLFQEIRSQIRFPSGSLSSPGRFRRLHPVSDYFSLWFFIFPPVRDPNNHPVLVYRTVQFGQWNIYIRHGSGCFRNKKCKSVSHLDMTREISLFSFHHRFHHSLYPAVAAFGLGNLNQHGIAVHGCIEIVWANKHIPVQAFDNHKSHSRTGYFQHTFV